MEKNQSSRRKHLTIALSFFLMAAVSLALVALAMHESPKALALAAEKAVASVRPSPKAAAKPSATPSPSASATPSATASPTASAAAKPVAKVVTPSPTPTPKPAATTPAVASTPLSASAGALFPNGLGSTHTCSASVVDSPGGNVIVTAAHCLSGSGVGVVFAPGYADGNTPYGTWVVTGAYVGTGWETTQDPNQDYAFLTVAPSSTNADQRPIQQVVGGLPLGTAPSAGTIVTVTGYASGRNDEAIVCTAATYGTSTSEGVVPTFTCGRFPGGTSGGRWVAGGTLVGVIGGLNQGGCTDPTSYSAPFNAGTASVLARAAAGGPADLLPQPGSDGC